MGMLGSALVPLGNSGGALAPGYSRGSVPALSDTAWLQDRICLSLGVQEVQLMAGT